MQQVWPVQQEQNSDWRWESETILPLPHWEGLLITLDNSLVQKFPANFFSFANSKKLFHCSIFQQNWNGKCDHKEEQHLSDKRKLPWDDHFMAINK